jgi:hypothetical protein
MSEDRVQVTDPSGNEIELIAGQVWEDSDGSEYELLDVPTDGPLFEDRSGTNHHFGHVQIESGKFREDVREGRMSLVVEAENK